MRFPLSNRAPLAGWLAARCAFVLGCVVLSTCSAFAAASSTVDWPTEPIEPIRAPFPMKQLARPTIPDRVVDIRDHGAVEGGKVKNTQAFADAIAACAKDGGGHVLVPAGRWLTGPIHLRSHIDLHLAEGAVVVFSDTFADYLPVVLVRVGGIEIYNYSPLIFARDCEDVAVTGPGKLDGNAAAWWAWQKHETRDFFEKAAAGVPVEKRVYGTPDAAIRPSFLCLMGCRNVLLEGFTIGSGPNWTIHPIYCEDVIIRRVNVDTHGPNNDGIDPDSCRNVLIEDCRFRTGDDCVVLKSGYNEDGWRVARPTENVVMRHCFSNEGHGGLVVGSEMSGDVRNVYVHDCEFDGTDRAVRIKSRGDRGGVVEHLWAERLHVRNMQREVVILNMDYSSDRNAAPPAHPPTFRDFNFSHITCEGAPVAIRVTGMEASPIRDLHFTDMAITSTQGVLAQHVRDLTFDHIAITPGKGPVYDLSDAHGVTINSATAPAGAPAFVHVAGATSGGIVIADTDMKTYSQPVQLADDAPKDAVTVR